jgi:hypothetical protein
MFLFPTYGEDVFMSASVIKTGIIKSLSHVIFQRSLIGELPISERSSRKVGGSTPTIFIENINVISFSYKSVFERVSHQWSQFPYFFHPLVEIGSWNKSLQEW